MRTQINKTSKGFPIKLDGIGTHLNNVPCVFKIRFKNKYFIWKGKSLTQSIDFIGKSISSCINKGNTDDTQFMYYVARYVKRYKVTFGEVLPEDIYTDFTTDAGNFSGLMLLKTEQGLLDDAANDPNCLNNNEQAYVPENNSYLSNKDKDAFLRWFEKRIKHGSK